VSSPYAQKGSSGGSVYAQNGTSGGSVYAGKGDGTPAPAKKGGGGFWHDVAKYSGADLAGNLAKDVGSTAVGVGPGLYKIGKDVGASTYGQFRHPFDTKRIENDPLSKDVKAQAQQYKDYYGHDVAHHLYTHPLQPFLDALTVAAGGAGAAAKVGKVAADAGAISADSRLARLAERAQITTRSPRAIATGKGPAHTDISSTKPLVKAREIVANKIRQANPEGVGAGNVRVGGEVKRFGAQIQSQATQHALGHLNDYRPYLKATHRLSQPEWAALHIRAMDIHPNDLAQLWKGTPAEKWATDPAVTKLVTQPSKKVAAAEQAARNLSLAGEKLLRDKKLLSEDTAGARPSLTKKQASEVLGRDVQTIHGSPYYLPHTLEDAGKPANPLSASGGGKGVPRKLGATKQNLGVLALTGKMHLRGDVLGPEFLRRVKFVKYDEIHNALVRGAVRISKQELDQHHGGNLPQGWEYVRTKPTKITRTVSAEADPNQLLIPGTQAATKTETVTVGGRSIPVTMRGQGDTHVPIDKLIPNADDLHTSQLARDGFSTTDQAGAHTSGGKYYIVPTRMVKAATGEFTRSSDFTHTFIKKPLSVWRSAVLGLRVGFLTNNLVGNSIMYAVKTGGTGALRDLFMAIRESHGDAVAKNALDSVSTPPALRQSLYQEFYPEQMHGTFGKTQSPSTSNLGAAGNKASAVWRGTTGAIPNVTSALAETAFRKALIRHSIRHSPEFKKVYAALPTETRNFETAARRLHEGKNAAAYQRYISKQANKALGDYLNLSPFERNVLRNAVPFYSWYRAITTTTGHLAADTPLRANILGQIGQIGKQWSDQKLGDVPSFLEGAIPIGHARAGIQRVLGTQSLNPYATLEQLYRAASGDVSALGLNPFLQGALDAYARKTGHGGKIGPAQLAGEVLKNIILGLPPSRLAHPTPPSKLYPKRDRKSEALSFLGAPVKDYDVHVAAQQKQQGR